MQRNDNMATTTTATNLWTKILAITSTTLAAVVAFTLGIMLDGALSRLTAVEQRLSVMGIEYSELATYSREHDRQATYWNQSVEANRQKLANISTNPTSRPDPFTGTQGRALERRLDLVERNCDRVQQKCQYLMKKRGDAIDETE